MHTQIRKANCSTLPLDIKKIGELFGLWIPFLFLFCKNLGKLTMFNVKATGPRLSSKKVHTNIHAFMCQLLIHLNKPAWNLRSLDIFCLNFPSLALIWRNLFSVSFYINILLNISVDYYFIFHAKIREIVESHSLNCVFNRKRKFQCS